MPIYLRFLFVVFMGLFVLTTTGCSLTATVARNAEMPYPLERAPQVGEILHIPTGTLVDSRQMMNIVTDARIVYVGETHDNPAAHRLQLSVLRAMAERYPGQVALGMEMFTPAQQPALDLWVSGKISEKEFLKSSRWYDTWSMDFGYYRPLLQFAREHKIPVLGLNADKSLVRAVGGVSQTDLTPEQKAQLPQMDLDDPYQRAVVEAIYRGHTHGKGELEAFVRVQTLWNETMAQNIAAYLADPDHGEMHMIVTAGAGHVSQGFGIPRRVFRRRPSSYVLVGSREIVIPEDKQDRLMRVDIPELPLPLYDFLEFTAYEDLEKPEASLGALLNGHHTGSVQVQEVLPGSAAEKAGLKKGDRLLSFDGQELQESFDLIYAVKQKASGDRGVLSIDRDGKTLTIEVIFTQPGKSQP